ncbi:MAG: VanZ family protein [Lachnospiraceae bacterium]|nr:VanZ family protein [Lachnospiraceae bacterium]
MLKYIISDMWAALRYLPCGIIAGLFAVFILSGINRGRKKRGKAFASLPAMTCLVMYVAVLLAITYFSRESGSRTGMMDLELFSTWGINDRNNAFVVENVLLFIPYGFVLAWANVRQRHFLNNFLTGALTSLAIETMQLVTGRGYFQIDDILTNILGTVLGFICYCLGHGICCLWRRMKGNRETESRKA